MSVDDIDVDIDYRIEDIKKRSSSGGIDTLLRIKLLQRQNFRHI